MFARQAAVRSSAWLGVFVVNSNLNGNLLEIRWRAASALDNVVDLYRPANGLKSAELWLVSVLRPL